MECMYCHNELGNGDFCHSCGRNVALYRKIVMTSNAYYNVGLEKASVRDLSGAAVYLKKSLDLYKKNTDARNLLGLIYFEMGEVVEALAEWVISKNLQPENNLATKYLKQIQSRQTRLKSMDQTLKKFNQALYYAKSGSEDLALLQAKKVINLNPRFIKAYQLLGLLYMKKGEYAKAEKTLKEVLKIDINNTLALQYLDEIKTLAKSKTNKITEKIRKEKRAITDDFLTEGGHDESIVPTYREGTGSGSTLLLLIVGVIVGVLFTYFLILPVKERDISSSYNSQMLSYNEKISERDTNITNLESQIKALEDEKASIQTELAAYTSSGGIITEYNKLLDCLNKKAAGQIVEAMDAFSTIDSTIVNDETFKSVYDSLKTELQDTAVPTLYALGKAQYDAGNWADAEMYFERVLKLQPDYPEVIFCMGICKQNQSDMEGAKTYYNMLIENPAYATTAWGQAALIQRGE